MLASVGSRAATREKPGLGVLKYDSRSGRAELTLARERDGLARLGVGGREKKLSHEFSNGCVYVKRMQTDSEIL